MEKKVYTSMELEIIVFENEDVINESLNSPNNAAGERGYNAPVDIFTNEF